MTTVTAHAPITAGVQIPNGARALRRIAKVLRAKRMERQTRERIEGLDAHMLRDIGIEPHALARRRDFTQGIAPSFGHS